MSCSSFRILRPMVWLSGLDREGGELRGENIYSVGRER
jgi:hypothetical protein